MRGDEACAIATAATGLIPEVSDLAARIMTTATMPPEAGGTRMADEMRAEMLDKLGHYWRSMPADRVRQVAAYWARYDEVTREDVRARLAAGVSIGGKRKGKSLSARKRAQLERQERRLSASKAHYEDLLVDSLNAEFARRAEAA
jgi:hypothetical protein